MSNWTPRRALYDLMSKFRKSDSDKSSNYFSADEGEDVLDETEEDSAPVSPLALRDENSPEAWLGQFLLILELGGLTKYGTIAGAMQDTELQSRLTSLREASAQEATLTLFDTVAGEVLKSRDWAAWWRAQEALTVYCYSTLALSMLGDTSHLDDIATMYSQDANSRIWRDAHFVLCYLLGKEWPGYEVRHSDLEALSRRPSSQ